MTGYINALAAAKVRNNCIGLYSKEWTSSPCFAGCRCDKEARLVLPIERNSGTQRLTPPTPSEADALAAVRTLIAYIGDDPDREGVRDTPQRVLKAWRDDWGRSYHTGSERLVKLFAQEGSASYDQMVVVRRIQFASTCEHHLATFYGTADVAYIPSAQGVVGLSKLARIVDYHARKLQVQERLTNEITDFIAQHISPNCAVVLRGVHMCMVTRGVQQPDAQTVTSALRGEFINDAAVRAEFFRLCNA